MFSKIWLIGLSLLVIFCFSLVMVGLKIKEAIKPSEKPLVTKSAATEVLGISHIQPTLVLASPAKDSAVVPSLSPTIQPTVIQNPTDVLVPTPTISTNIVSPPPNQLKNGFFQNSLVDWQTTGQVVIGSTSQICSTQDSEFRPQFSQFVRLGSASDWVALGTNVLAQQLQLNSKIFGVEFWYRIWSFETSLGFDDPVLMVSLDDQILWRVGAAVALNETILGAELTAPACSGWKRGLAAFPLLSSLSNNSHQLKFLTGQTGDSQNPSWVEISAIALLTQPIDIVSSSSWPEAIELEIAKTQINLINKSLTGTEVLTKEVPELMTKLQQVAHACKYSLQQPLISPFELSLVNPAHHGQPDFILAADFPFSLDHEGFMGGLTVSAQISDQQLIDFKPSWLKIQSRSNLPVMVLPIISRRNELL